MSTHIDAYANKTDHANQNPVDEFTSFNSSATDDIILTHPKGGRKAIELQKPQLVAMAQENRYDYDSEKYEGNQGVDEVFDEALCDVAELSLRQAGMADCEVSIHKLRALIIQEARDLNNTELANHISQYSSEEIEQFGLKKAYSVSTYRKAKNQVMDTEPEALLDATFIAVFALFWNGVLIPVPVKEKYNLSYNTGPAASEYSDAVRGSALYAIVSDLLDIIVEPLDFQEDKTANELRNLIGAFAHAACINRSVENYEQTAQHLFDLSSAPSGRGITALIAKQKLSKVKNMFDEIYQRLLKYVLESGVVPEPVLVSYDLTKIESLGITEFDDTFLTEDGRWRFASLAFTDPDLEFAFGLRLLKSKDRRSEVFSNFLRDLTSMVDVRLFMADREFDGAEDIEACRKFVAEK